MLFSGSHVLAKAANTKPNDIKTTTIEETTSLEFNEKQQQLMEQYDQLQIERLIDQKVHSSISQHSSEQAESMILNESIIINTNIVTLDKNLIKNCSNVPEGISITIKDLLDYKGDVTVSVENNFDYSFLPYLKNANLVMLNFNNEIDSSHAIFDYIEFLNKVEINFNVSQTESTELDKVKEKLNAQLGINSGENVFLSSSLVEFDISQLDSYVKINDKNYFYYGYYFNITELINYTGKVTIEPDYDYYNQLDSVFKVFKNADISVELYLSDKKYFNQLTPDLPVDNYILNIYSGDLTIDELNNFIEKFSDSNIIINYTVYSNPVDNQTGFEYLNQIKYAENVKFNLEVAFDEKFDYSIINPNISSLRLLFSENHHFDLNEDSLSFLSNLANLDKVVIKIDNYNVDYDINWLDKYNIKNLYLEFNILKEFEVDFKKVAEMSTLKGIYINARDVYDVAIYLNDETLDLFRQNGIEVVFSNNIDIEKFNFANDKIDEIIEQLDLSPKASEKDKYHAILSYILKNYTFDEEIAAIEEEDSLANELVDKKYIDGYLGAIMEGDSEIICGNYAALFEALATRLGIDSLMAFSHNHAWNIVKLDGEYYYVDTTWLDGDNDLYIIELLESNRIEDLENLGWYKFDINYYYDGHVLDNNSHKMNTVPNIEIDIAELVNMYGEVDIPELTNITKPLNITAKVCKMTFNNKQYIVPAEVLMGILVGGKIAKNITQFIKEEDIELPKFKK